MQLFIGGNIYPEIERVLDDCGRMINIAMFQFQSESFAQILIRKAQSGVAVELFTLPITSVNANNRAQVTDIYSRMETAGCIIHKCEWNIGSPERTSTAANVWFSFHGKFIVTESSAVSLTANLLENNEFDACIVSDEQGVIDEFNERFRLLKRLFIEVGDQLIRQQIENAEDKDPEALAIPAAVNNHDMEEKWIRHYPESIFENVQIMDGSHLYICPFNQKARSLYMDIIDQATEYVYIVAETLTDEDLMKYLIQKKSSQSISIKILCGDAVMDNQHKATDQFIKLIAAGASIYTMANLHAKILLTDNKLVVSSINCNKINLGFKPKPNQWRANTETATITDERQTIADAKQQLDMQFANSQTLIQKISLKEKGRVKDLFKIFANVSTIRNDAAGLVADYVIEQRIQVFKSVKNLASLTKMLIGGRREVRKDDIVKAIILVRLQNRKHTLNELQDELSVYSISTGDTSRIASELAASNHITIEQVYYKLVPRGLD